MAKKNNKKKQAEVIKLEEYQDETDLEQELVDSYMNEELEEEIAKEKEEKRIRKANEKILHEELKDDDLEEYEIEDDFVEEKKEEYDSNRTKKILKIVAAVVCILILLAIIDVVCVTKFEKGPFFAIPMHTYDDGGTKEYYGLGYKVIKYHQVQGRRDMEIGSWALKYNVEPIYSEIIDLAIEFNMSEKDSYAKYMKQLLVVTGTLKEVDKENNRIVLAYEDEGGKYSIDVVCNMETDQESLSILEPKYEVSAMGTMIGYDPKAENRIPTIYLDNCFSEQ